MAVLDDYAFFLQGLLDLYEASFDVTWLDEALRLQSLLDARYADDANGGYFMTADDAEALLVRDKPSHDGAEPSGSSVAALNLLRLHELTTEDKWRARAEKSLAAAGAGLARGGASMPKMLCALDFYLDAPREIVIVRAADDEPGARELTRVVRRSFVPNRMLALVSEGDALRDAAKRIPLLDGKIARSGKSTAYVCEQGICELPTSDPRVFERQLAKVRPLSNDDGAAAALPVRLPGD